jgi:hypothetical protein
MEDTIQTIKQALDVLLAEGWELFQSTLQSSESANTLSFLQRHMPYQTWYTKALRVITQLYPERSGDFQAHYHALLALQDAPPSMRWYRKVLHVMHRCTIRRRPKTQDHKNTGRTSTGTGTLMTGQRICMGMTIAPNGESIPSLRLTFVTHFAQQLRMLNAVRDGLEYVLTDLRSTLYGTVESCMLDTVYTLSHHGHCRAAGALAGILLETHLIHIAAKYRVATRTASTDITRLNTALKCGGIYDGELWHFIQRLGALRDVWVYSSRLDPCEDELMAFLHDVQTVCHTVR